jgi:hypothetical protein
MEMNNEQLLRWLIQFGSDWVHQDVLNHTWADTDLTWTAQQRFGLLDIDTKTVQPEWRVRLTQQALDRLKDTYER